LPAAVVRLVIGLAGEDEAFPRFPEPDHDHIELAGSHCRSSPCGKMPRVAGLPARYWPICACDENFCRSCQCRAAFPRTRQAFGLEPPFPGELHVILLANFIAPHKMPRTCS
jgi:hypothetical protein